MRSKETKILRLMLKTLSTLIILSYVFSKSLILEPINKQETLEEIGLVFVQGASIESTSYVKLCKKIQEENKNLKIWVSITNAFFDLPISIIGSEAINTSLKDLFSSGLGASAKVFLLGHSLGGKAAMDFYLENQQNKNIKGLVMLGSIPERKIREKSENLNVLVLGGELDGLSRVTRLAEEFYHRNLDTTKNYFKNLSFNFESNENENRKNSADTLKFLETENNLAYTSQSSNANNSTSTAVILLHGLNHMSFAGGKPTWLVAQRDLKSEVSEDSAHSAISEQIRFFISNNINAINKALENSYTFLQPIIKAFELEGSIHFNRPDQTKCHRGYCSQGSKWTVEAQKILSVESLLNSKNVSLNITNDFVILSSLPPLGDLFHPKRNLKNNTLSISTYSQCSWDLIDEYVDAGFSPISASEIGSKMFSRQCSLVYGAKQKKEDTPLSIDTEGNICVEINKQALAWALGKSAKQTLSRFNEFGQKINFVDDKYFVNGFSWTYSVLKWEENKDSGDFDVRSFTMVTDIDAKPIPIFAPDGLDCYHYCKLLSPARAIEWIYVDGLRKKYKIEN